MYTPQKLLSLALSGVLFCWPQVVSADTLANQQDSAEYGGEKNSLHNSQVSLSVHFSPLLLCSVNSHHLGLGTPYPQLRSSRAPCGLLSLCPSVNILCRLQAGATVGFTSSIYLFRLFQVCLCLCKSGVSFIRLKFMFQSVLLFENLIKQMISCEYRIYLNSCQKYNKTDFQSCIDEMNMVIKFDEMAQKKITNQSQL